jgi:hypothetical protein
MRLVDVVLSGSQTEDAGAPRDEISDVRVIERSTPGRAVARTDDMQSVTAKRESLRREGSSMVAFDVRGPIVTGVLGGD